MSETKMKKRIDASSLEDYPKILQTLLKNRGIDTPEEIREFLNPDYAELADPFTLHDMDKAVERIVAAIANHEHIAIYADYDADGIPGAVLLYDFFQQISYESVEVYIPHRHREGYGFHKDAVDQLIEQGVQLIITIDVGISDQETALYAQSQGVDVIVTDHHEPSETLPEAYALVHPKLPGSGGEPYADPMLCGAAVAFQLVRALVAHERFDIHDGWEKWLLDMVGIATLSDMVPLRNENRILAFYGLHVLRKSRRPGLRTLLRKLRTQQAYVSEDDVTFLITPRINAASRIGEPIDALNALSERDPARVQAAVERLEELNKQRKTLVAQTIKQAHKALKERPVKEVIVVGNPDWQAGVLGLIAMKLTEEYHRPAFVWSVEGDMVKGSCRSPANCSVLDLMNAVSSELFSGFGGHAFAGGFSTTKESIHFLEEALVDAYPECILPDEAGAFSHDMEFHLDDITMDNWTLIHQLAPFGEGNPKPTFLFPNVTITDVKQFGKGKEHLELSFTQSSGKTVRAIRFFTRLDHFSVTLESGARVSMIASLELSRFNGSKELRLRIETLA